MWLIWSIGAADQKLLLTILATHDIKVDYDAVALSFGSHCTPRAVQERIKKLQLIAKNDGVSSADSTPSKPSATAAAKKAAVSKTKADAKAKAPEGKTQARKKRKINNGGIAAGKTDSDEESLPSCVNGAGKNEEDGNDSHKMIKEEPFVYDDDLSDSGLSFSSHSIHFTRSATRLDSICSQDMLVLLVVIHTKKCWLPTRIVSAFDPAEDQLLAEHDLSFEAV